MWLWFTRLWHHRLEGRARPIPESKLAHPSTSSSLRCPLKPQSFSGINLLRLWFTPVYTTRTGSIGRMHRNKPAKQTFSVVSPKGCSKEESTLVSSTILRTQLHWTIWMYGNLQQVDSPRLTVWRPNCPKIGQWTLDSKVTALRYNTKRRTSTHSKWNWVKK